MPAEVARHAAGFVRALRAAGLTVPVGSSINYLQALGEVGVDEGDDVYWGGRATLIHRPEDIPVYDAVFDHYWRRSAISIGRPVEEETITLALDDDDGGSSDGDDDGESGPVLSVRYSDTEVLRDKDFAVYSDAELAEARRLMTQLRLCASPRRSRRRRRSKGTSGRPDLRRTVRRALRTGGEPIVRAFDEPGERPRRLVLLLDVSGSMEAYARALARFVHAAVVGRTKVEAFAVGTRLTRITRELQSRDPDAALAKAGAAVSDWSGGTRLGDGLRQFNDEWGVRGMARGAIVVVLSDGWDRGDPAVMAEQMERLHRVAFRVIWVNPLKASPGYAPLAQGMAAALPHVDEFVEGHSLSSLETLAELIAA